MNRALIGLGCNMGDRIGQMYRGMDLISAKPNIYLAESSLYESAPWGYDSENWFLNAVLMIDTPMDPADLLTFLLNLESEAGRIRTGYYTDRPIDADLLLWDGLPGSSFDLRPQGVNLIVPHPAMHQRRFVLKPLAEIAGHWIHPGTQKAIGALLTECSDEGQVQLFRPPRGPR